MRETLPPESSDVLRAMKTTLTTAGGSTVHLALAVVLLAACSVNLLLVCARL
jgi:hypothetical protein